MSNISGWKVRKREVIKIGKFSLKKERVVLTLCFLPFLVFIILFNYVPLAGWALAFINYKPGLKLSQCDFVGLEYFILIFENWKKT